MAAGVTTNFADLNRADYITERMQTAGTWAMVESAFNGAIFLLLGFAAAVHHRRDLAQRRPRLVDSGGLSRT